ncbi:ABC transporter ATP-binding protein [Streptomyces sp. NPDC001250]|uniref:ABC transporter ATP-binding protein n=1 Tax=unclassified Streptomyces TaxID=2593676 RepID=UPI0033189AEB
MAQERGRCRPEGPGRILVRAVWQRPGHLVAFAVASVLAAATGLLLPQVLSQTIDTVLRHGGAPHALARLGVVVITSVAAQAVAGLAGAACVVGASVWLRRLMLQHIFALGPARSARFAPGDLINRLLGDAAQTAHALPVMAGIVLSLGTSLGGAIALWLIDPLLGLTLLAGLPPLVLLMRRFMAGSTDLHARYERTFTSIVVRLSDALTGVRTIRAAGTTGREVHRVLAPLPELARTAQATWQLQRQAVWKSMLLMPLMEIAVLAVAGWAVAAGRIPPGELVAAGAYVGIALGAVGQVDALMGLAAARASVGRILEVLSLPAPVTADAPHPVPPKPGCIAFEAVTVRAGEQAVLDGIDLSVPAGTSLALVGRSGAGKSTLAALAGRLTDADQGRVLLDGTDITHFDRAALRDRVAYAFERPALFGDTVADAIAYARPAATRAEIEQAAIAARADTFIQRLPEGYDTPLAKTPLSGGEAQRLGLARAVAQDACVLVLDDATSSLDTVTEAEVSRALAELFKDRTRIIVAHRASTAARADLVAWLEEGCLRAVAPHAQLWDDPDYRAVFGTHPTAASEETS